MKNLAIFLIACLLMCVQTLSSQTDILYFMQNVPLRSELNPAFVPTQKVYVNLLPGLSVNAATNSFAANDFIKSINGGMKTAFDADGDAQSFLNALKPENKILADGKINLVGFGFKVKKNYFSLGVSEKIAASANAPYELAWLLLEGLPKTNETKDLNLSSFAVDASTYAETSLGYAREILPNFTAAVKMKVLLGQVHSDIAFNNLNVKGNYSQSVLSGDGAVRMNTSFEIPPDKDNNPNMDSVKFTPQSLLKFCGSGLAFDLGIVYKPLRNLTLSVSLTDLGSIGWNKNNWTGTVNTATEFKNMSYKINDNHDNVTGSDSLGNAFAFSQSNLKYSSKLTSHTRIGVEYSILNDKIGFGLLYDYRKSAFYSEDMVMGTVNFRPFYALNASIGYSQLNAKSSSLSAGLNLNLAGMSIYVLSDYVPLSFADKYIPKSNHINLQAGMVFTFGRVKKSHAKKEEDKPEEN